MSSAYSQTRVSQISGRLLKVQFVRELMVESQIQFKTLDFYVGLASKQKHQHFDKLGMRLNNQLSYKLQLSFNWRKVKAL